MKQKYRLTLLISLLAVSLLSVPLITKVSGLKKANQNVNKDIAYHTDFEGMTISQTSTADINTGFIWVNRWQDAKTETHKGSNMLYAPLIDSDDYSIVGGFGIGSAGNLARCRNDESYTCSTYLEFGGMDHLFVEVICDSWGSIILYKDGSLQTNPGGTNMSDVSYKNNILTFTFTKHPHNRDGVDGYIKFTGYNCKDAYCYFDDVTIQRAKYMMNEKFDNFAEQAFNNDSKLHHNLYLEDNSLDARYVKENNNMLAKFTYNPEALDKKDLFYINKLGFLNKNREYAVSLDLSATNVDSLTLYYGGSYVSEKNHFDIDFTDNSIKNIQGNKFSNIKYENGKLSFNLNSNVEFSDYQQFELAATPKQLSEVVVKVDNIQIEQLPTIDSITLNYATVKQTYYIGDKLDLTNLVVIANYTDETSKEIAQDKYQASNFNSEISGKQTVVITYENCSASYLVNVIKKVNSLALDTTEVKKEFAYGEQINFDGLKVIATYDKIGDVELSRGAFNDGYSINQGKYDPYKPGRYTITIIYQNKEASYEVEVKPSQEIRFDVSYLETGKE